MKRIGFLAVCLIGSLFICSNALAQWKYEEYTNEADGSVTIFILSDLVSWGQSTRSDSSKYLIRDTMLLVAKEYCQNSATTCWFGDDVHLNRMLIYDGPMFWKNYPSMLFYFTGLDLRNYQEKNNIDYEYLQNVEELLSEDIKNDSNRIVLLNKRRRVKNGKRVDTVQYKLYRIRCAYVYAKRTNEFVPNFFKPKSSEGYIFYPSNIYYITKIESISPFNEIPSKDRTIKVNGK